MEDCAALLAERRRNPCCELTTGQTQNPATPTYRAARSSTLSGDEKRHEGKHPKPAYRLTSNPLFLALIPAIPLAVYMIVMIFISGFAMMWKFTGLKRSEIAQPIW